MPTARSTPNIAFIKYWGNRNNAYRLPAADSLSMTLSSPHVDVTVEIAEQFSVQSFDPDGSEKELTDKHVDRFRTHLTLVREYLSTIGVDALPDTVSITVRSHIPPAVGLASSAAVFSCTARAYAGVVQEQRQLTVQEMSVIARLGSGSAARSIMGGFVTLENTHGNGIESAHAVQIADEHHWMLHDIVIIPSLHEKTVGSTEGHAIAQTSPHFAKRIADITSRRQRDCIDAILTKDLEKLQSVSEEDALDMHHVMETSSPPLQYLTEETHRILTEVKELRSSQHLPVFFTMDAGPTVHLICTNEALEAIRGFSSMQKNCTIFETQIGAGATLLD